MEQNQTDVPEKSPSSTMLYVSNLPFSFADEDLAGLFEQFQVISAYIARRRNGRSKGFGFVNLQTAEEQQKALETVDGTDVDGRTLTVKVAHQDDRRDLQTGQLKEEFLSKREEQNEKKKRQTAQPVEKEPTETVLYVSNLPFGWEEENLRDLFSDFTVNIARVAKRRNGKSKGFGFVEVANKEEQTAAIEKLNGFNVQGDGEDAEERELQVKVSFTQLYPEGETPEMQRKNEPEKKKKRKKKKKKPENDNSAPQEPRELSDNVVYVSSLPATTDDEQLLAAFKPHGAVSARVAVRRNGRSKRFGFVTLEDNAAQQKLLAEDFEVVIEDAVLGITAAYKEAQEQPNSETMVYVSNLPFSADAEDLKSIFDGFNITNAYISQRAGGRSKGFGFVDFATNEEQQKALDKDKTEFMERQLTVQVAKVPPPKKDVDSDNQNDDQDEN